MLILKHAVLVMTILWTTVIPATAEILFQGSLKFTKVNSACTQGPEPGQIYTSQFHPAAVLGNFNYSALNRFHHFGATSYRTESGGFDANFKQVRNTSISWSDFTPARPSFVLVSRQDPATLTAQSKSLFLAGQIKNPYGRTGQDNCVASFVFSGVVDEQ